MRVETGIYGYNQTIIAATPAITPDPTTHGRRPPAPLSGLKACTLGPGAPGLGVPVPAPPLAGMTLEFPPAGGGTTMPVPTDAVG